MFYEDLEEKITYIAETLHNEKAILERLPIDEAFEPYRSMKERRYNDGIAMVQGKWYQIDDT